MIEAHEYQSTVAEFLKQSVFEGKIVDRSAITVRFAILSRSSMTGCRAGRQNSQKSRNSGCSAAENLNFSGLSSATTNNIVNIASLHADLTSAGMFPYAAAKSGLVGLTRSLALEVGPRQVRVNALSPGYTETPLAKDWFRAQPPEKRQEVLARSPDGPDGKPDGNRQLRGLSPVDGSLAPPLRSPPPPGPGSPPPLFLPLPSNAHSSSFSLYTTPHSCSPRTINLRSKHLKTNWNNSYVLNKGECPIQEGTPLLSFSDPTAFRGRMPTSRRSASS